MMHDPFAAMSPGRSDEAPAAVPLPWRGFLRALADEIDAQRGEAARDEFLRATGRRMARLLPLPEVASVEALALEMNEALASLGWGSTTLTLEENEKRLTILHSGLPRLGGAGEPPGLWLSAVLEGLYETWIAQQPGSDPHLVARRFASPAPGAVALRYGRG
jgi:hypothetical protein